MHTQRNIGESLWLENNREMDGGLFVVQCVQTVFLCMFFTENKPSILIFRLKKHELCAFSFSEIKKNWPKQKTVIWIILYKLLFAAVRCYKCIYFPSDVRSARLQSNTLFSTVMIYLCTCSFWAAHRYYCELPTKQSALTSQGMLQTSQVTFASWVGCQARHVS